jgi:Transglycosylase-like domain
MRWLLAAACASCMLLLVSPAQAHGLPSWWVQQALCVHSHEGSWTANTGNGFYGGMQFMLSTWRSSGGWRYAFYPHQATPHEQLHVAYMLWRRAGWSPWPNTSRMCGLR